jgi:hypothetical protein
LEAEITELKVVVNRLPARLDHSEADIACAASEAAELRAAVLRLKGWTAPEVDSLIIA